MQDRIHYHILKQIQDKPGITQRELAQCLGVSLGKVHYCLKALMVRGSVTAKHFKNSRNKQAYLYQLTPKGVEEKLQVAKRFFKVRLKDYELIQQELQDLKQELNTGDRYFIE